MYIKTVCSTIYFLPKQYSDNFRVPPTQLPQIIDRFELILFTKLTHLSETFCFLASCWPCSKESRLRNVNVHASDICRSSFYQLRNLSKITYLTQESREIAVHAFIKSKLDYCNSLLYGCRKMQLKKLQYVQNTLITLHLFYLTFTGFLLVIVLFWKFFG